MKTAHTATKSKLHSAPEETSSRIEKLEAEVQLQYQMLRMQSVLLENSALAIEQIANIIDKALPSIVPANPERFH